MCIKLKFKNSENIFTIIFFYLKGSPSYNAMSNMWHKHIKNKQVISMNNLLILINVQFFFDLNTSWKRYVSAKNMSLSIMNIDILHQLKQEPSFQTKLNLFREKQNLSKKKFRKLS